MTWMIRKYKIHHGKHRFLKKCWKEIDRMTFLKVGTNNYRRFHGKRPIRKAQVNKALDREYRTKWREK